MRKILMAALFCLCMHAALAEIPCVCHQEPCKCFMQLGDESIPVAYIQEALVSQGFLRNRDDSIIFDEATRQAVIAFQEAHGLNATGMLDDVTLTLLLWGMRPDELDAAQPDTIGGAVWIPTDGGKRHHRRAGCSAMLDPRLVSQRNALMMGMLPCGRCKPDGFNTELTPK